MQGQCPVGRYNHTITPVGSKLFLFGGQVDKRYLNDLWSFDSDSREHWPTSVCEHMYNDSDLLSVGLTPSWLLHELPLGSEIPPARVGHVSVSYGDKLFMFVPPSSSRQSDYTKDSFA